MSSSLLNNIPSLSFFDFIEYFRLLKNKFFTFSDLKEYLKRFIFRILKFLIILFLSSLFFHLSIFYIYVNQNTNSYNLLDINKNELQSKNLQILDVVLSIFWLINFSLIPFYVFYKIVDIIYFTNTYWLDKLGYEVKKIDTLMFKIGPINIKSAYYYNVSTLVSFVLTPFFSLFNIFHKKQLIYSLAIIILILLFAFYSLTFISILLLILLIILVLRNFVRFSFFYQYFITTDLKLINSYRTSYEKTQNQGMKIFLSWLVVLFILMFLDYTLIVLISNLLLISEIQSYVSSSLRVLEINLMFNKEVEFTYYFSIALINSVINTYSIFFFLFILSFNQIFLSTLFKLHYDEIKDKK
ncbi:MAG: hypothetical protein QW076_00780 [Candidatus Anstonellales archaeon]